MSYLYKGAHMRKFLMVVLVIASIATSSFAADDTFWKVFTFSKSTPDSVIMIFGPPSTIKTEELYSDWVKSQTTGCGQLHTYAMNYSIASGDLNILKGPLGKASEASVVIENGRYPKSSGLTTITCYNQPSVSGSVTNGLKPRSLRSLA